MKQNNQGGTPHYSPNLVYVLSIDNSKFYVGCHTVSKKWLTENNILLGSGNPLKGKYTNKEITIDEYKQRVQLIRIEECISREDALNLEIQLIQEYKEAFGDVCINKLNEGNTRGSYGTHLSEATRKKLSKVNKGKVMSLEARRKMSIANKGKHLSEETRKKMSETQKNRLSSEEARRKLSEASKGRHPSKETREKLSEAFKKRVRNKQTNEIYPSLKYLSNLLGVTPSAISSGIHKQRPKYSIYEYVED